MGGAGTKVLHKKVYEQRKVKERNRKEEKLHRLAVRKKTDRQGTTAKKPRENVKAYGDYDSRLMIRDLRSILSERESQYLCY